MAVGSKDLTSENLRGFDDDRLVDELRKAKEELFNLRFQSATGQLDNHGRLRAVRKDIARIYTEMRERELDIGREAAGMSENTKDEAVKAASDRNYRKTRQGYVVSDKMDKTVVVEVEDRVKHALYGKVMRRTQQGQGPRRAERRRYRRPRPDHGDPPALGHQALARGGDPREGQVSTARPAALGRPLSDRYAARDRNRPPTVRPGSAVQPVRTSSTTGVRQ